MQGEFIADRLLPAIVERICKTRDIECVAFSDQWVLRLRRHDVTKWIVGYHFDIDGAATTNVAKDKVATYQALQAQNVSAVEHYLARSLGSSIVPYASLASLEPSSPYLVKPLQGSGGRMFHVYQSLAAALSFIEATPGDWAISPLISIVSEKRIIMLDNHVLLSYVKTKPQLVNGIYMHNLGHGAEPVSEVPSEAELAIVQQAMQAIGLRLAAVDIITQQDGSISVLEINTGIMMEHYVRISPAHYESAVKVYDAIIQAQFER